MFNDQRIGMLCGEEFEAINTSLFSQMVVKNNGILTFLVCSEPHILSGSHGTISELSWAIPHSLQKTGEKIIDNRHKMTLS